MVEETRPEIELLAQAAAIINHDLSNPLQSLTVLIELAIEELEETSGSTGPAAHAEIAKRLQQSLGACSQIRVLMREFSSLLVGTVDCERAGNADQVLSRVLGLMGRRVGRSDVLVERNTAALAKAPGSEATTFALLGIVLPVVLQLHEREGPSRLGLQAQETSTGITLQISPAPADRGALQRARSCAAHGGIEIRSAGDGEESMVELAWP